MQKRQKWQWVYKRHPYDQTDLPTLDSVDATGICIPILNNRSLVCTCTWTSGCAWSDIEIIKVWSSRHKPSLANDVKAKHPLCNSAVSNPSCENTLDLFVSNEFETSAPQCQTYYYPVGNGDVPGTVMHENVLLWDIIVSDILDSDHQPIIYHKRDYVTIRNFLDPVENIIEWKWFECLACELISPRIKINSGIKWYDGVRLYTFL
jgi:hypothetical protein